MRVRICENFGSIEVIHLSNVPNNTSSYSTNIHVCNVKRRLIIHELADRHFLSLVIYISMDTDDTGSSQYIFARSRKLRQCSKKYFFKSTFRFPYKCPLLPNGMLKFIIKNLFLSKSIFSNFQFRWNSPSFSLIVNFLFFANNSGDLQILSFFEVKLSKDCNRAN